MGVQAALDGGYSDHGDSAANIRAKIRGGAAMRLERFERGFSLVTRAIYYIAGLISLVALILFIAKGGL